MSLFFPEGDRALWMDAIGRATDKEGLKKLMSCYALVLIGVCPLIVLVSLANSICA